MPPNATSLALPDRPASIPLGWWVRLPFPVRNVLRRWRGLVGMMLGVGMALGIVMTLSGVGKAIFQVYTLDYERSSADLYVITQGGTLIPYVVSDSPGTFRQARHKLSEIRSIPGVRSAVGVITWQMEREHDGPKRRFDDYKELVTAMGVDGDPTEIPGMLGINEGRWLRRSNEVVLGARLAQDRSLGIGDTLRLNGRDFTVVGIGRLRGFGFSLDSLAYLDYDAFRQRTELGDVLSIIAVDTVQPDVVRERIGELGSLSTFSTAELIKRAEAVLVDRLVTYYILDALALAIGALFVGTMLNNSVAERRLEFATLRAIGVPSLTILQTVAYEALLISLVAGVIGVALSLFLGSLLNSYLAQKLALELLFSADARLFLQVFALAVALGLVAGLLPARAATRVDPVEVLREA